MYYMTGEQSIERIGDAPVVISSSTNLSPIVIGAVIIGIVILFILLSNLLKGKKGQLSY